MRFYSFLLLLSIYQLTFSQEIVYKADVNLSFPDLKETMAFVDDFGRPNFIFIDDKEITQITLNEKRKESEKTFPRPPETFPRIQGYDIGSDNSLNLYFSNYRGDGFFLMSLAEDKKPYAKQFDLKFDSHERFLSTINFKNQFYLLTYIKDQSIINIYSFDKDGHTVQTHDLSNFSFYTPNNYLTSLGSLMDKEETEVIEDNIPYSISTVSKKIKIYPKEDYLILSLNHKSNGTRIIKLDLNEGTKTSYFIENIGASDTKKANSFIGESKLFQFSVSSDFLALSIHDIESQEKLADFSVKKGQDFLFKNSPIYQEGSLPYFPLPKTSGSNRAEIKTSQEFLRKLSNSEVGIYALVDNDIIEITLGGIKEVTVSGRMISYSYSSFGVSVSPVYWNFIDYIASRSVLTKLVFDSKTLSHLDKKATSNVFDRISMKSRYLKNSVLKKKLKLENIFKKDDYFLYGYYNKKEKTYSLMKFDK